MDLIDVEKQSAAIRERYHELEKQIHGTEWTAEEDALAFLTDAALVGGGRWQMQAAGQVMISSSCLERLVNASGGWQFWRNEMGIGLRTASSNFLWIRRKNWKDERRRYEEACGI